MSGTSKLSMLLQVTSFIAGRDLGGGRGAEPLKDPAPPPASQLPDHLRRSTRSDGLSSKARRRLDQYLRPTEVAANEERARQEKVLEKAKRKKKQADKARKRNR